MSIAGHVSREMLSRYSHVRNEAKRKALEEIYARQTATEIATRKKRDAQRRQGRTVRHRPECRLRCQSSK